MGSNAVGRKAQKCQTSRMLDEVFPDGSEVGSFSIPHDEQYMFQAQLSSALYTDGYLPLPGYTIAESLEVSARNGQDQEESETLAFVHSDELGWLSKRAE